MYIVQVHIKVNSEDIEAFIKTTLDNANKSIHEPGIARFDIFQESNDPTRFVLVEVYRTSGDPLKHKETEHYKRWREIAEPLMSEPRIHTVYTNLFPADKVY